MAHSNYFKPDGKADDRGEPNRRMRRAMNLLRILALGNRQIHEGEAIPMAEALALPRASGRGQPRA